MVIYYEDAHQNISNKYEYMKLLNDEQLQYN